LRSFALSALISVALLLVGCLSGGAMPPPWQDPNPIGPERSFDGTPTHLSLSFERVAGHGQVPGLNSQHGEPEVAYVRVTNQHGMLVVYEDVELEAEAQSFNVDCELPADRGLSVNAIIIQRNKFLEMAVKTGIDAPARTITNVLIDMEKPNGTLALPELMYSGDEVEVIIPDYQRPYMSSSVLIGVNPWQENGTSGLFAANRGGSDELPGIVLTEVSRFLPVTTEPIKLYYQVRLSPFAYLGSGRGELATPLHS